MFTTTLEGEDQILNRMEAFNKDVWRALQTDVKRATDLIGASARGMIPANPTSPTEAQGWLSTGRLGWSQQSVAGSIKPKFRSRQVRGRRYVMGLVDMNNPAGSLYSLAGSKTSTQFGDLMNDFWGTKYPRALGPAWTMHVDKTREAIQKAVDDAARKVAL